MAEFTDRYDAGRQLAEHLASRGWPGEGRAGVGPPVVLGLPRGGVPVAEVVARELGAPLDVIMVRKLGVPAHPELAMGAIGEQGARVLDASIVRHYAVTAEQVAEVERRERETLQRRGALFRAGRAPLDLHGASAVIVDDGMATGATARVACSVARHLGAAHVVLAVPVAARDTVSRIREEGEADEVLVVATPRFFRSVGEHYADFAAVQDERVVAILQQP
ncbi:phosphoribosyltransferase family protein [Citricoccus sp.]|uniref:phosphoribosyltransferase n=1 Tax=Citricoccus sp. TaxID=1978372 RepID=UPI0028BE8C84|nr:phosphoribosyltransferase family protein [Citricoccus sp.]